MPSDMPPGKKKPVKKNPEIQVPGKDPELIPDFPEEEPFLPEHQPEIRPEREPDEPFPPEFPLT
jgi:hypothetical protein